MRILTTLLIVTLLYACYEKTETELTTFKVIQGTKCTDETPTGGACAEEAVGLIELDKDGNPSAVNIINACENKTVTWKYKNEYAGGDAPPFLVVFDPSIFPGNSNYTVLSKPKPNANNAQNQELTLNTRKLKGEENECLNYAVMIPGKGLLDPIFILKR